MPEPGADQVLVQAVLSGISAGTEMLVYRGQLPRNTGDRTDPLSADLHYPVCYGYASVGRVLAVGRDVDRRWQDRLIFAFQPHRSHYVASPESLFPVPDPLLPQDGVFLPNMETAVNLIQDAEPVLGECVLILGQGVVGLLAAGLLRQFPVHRLVTADRFELRRNASLKLGVDASLDPTFEDFHALALQALPSSLPGFDLTLEVSGNPAAVDDAVALTAFSGRIVIGSWYGEKRAPIDLGGKFHRSRLSVMASQVSTISPKLSARWSKARRFEVAWEALRDLRPHEWITHRYSLGDAAEAYRMLDQSPEQALQVVLSYP
ncbi:MAG TPA: zinc-binding alcohol dehydrogenase [Anaerolineales bacterium]